MLTSLQASSAIPPSRKKAFQQADGTPSVRRHTRRRCSVVRLVCAACQLLLELRRSVEFRDLPKQTFRFRWLCLWTLVRRLPWKGRAGNQANAPFRRKTLPMALNAAGPDQSRVPQNGPSADLGLLGKKAIDSLSAESRISETLRFQVKLFHGPARRFLLMPALFSPRSAGPAWRARWFAGGSCREL